MEKITVFIILIIIIALAFIAFIYLNGGKIYEMADSNKNGDELISDNEMNADSIEEKFDDDLKSDNSSSRGVTGLALNQGESSQETLPDYVYTSPCGIYFNEYGFCGGLCADGECISEGRSCYCKID